VPPAARTPQRRCCTCCAAHSQGWRSPQPVRLRRRGAHPCVPRPPRVGVKQKGGRPPRVGDPRQPTAAVRATRHGPRVPPARRGRPPSAPDAPGEGRTGMRKAGRGSAASAKASPPWCWRFSASAGRGATRGAASKKRVDLAGGHKDKNRGRSDGLKKRVADSNSRNHGTRVQYSRSRKILARQLLHHSDKSASATP